MLWQWHMLYYNALLPQSASLLIGGLASLSVSPTTTSKSEEREVYVVRSAM